MSQRWKGYGIEEDKKMRKNTILRDNSDFEPRKIALPAIFRLLARLSSSRSFRSAPYRFFMIKIVDILC